jgi:hypothetical protein
MSLGNKFAHFLTYSLVPNNLFYASNIFMLAGLLPNFSNVSLKIN